MSQTKQRRVRSDSFPERLARMSAAERRRATSSFSRSERAAWAARYPEEVPLVNGELAWIAIGLADLD